MRRCSIVVTSLIAALSLPALAQQEQKPANPDKPAQGDRPQRQRNQDGQPGGGGGGGGGRQGMGGPQLNPERSAAAWKLQAEGVAKRFDLDPTSTTTLVDAYAAARKENQAVADKAREEMRKEMENDSGGDRRETMRKMMVKQDEIQTASRESLKKAISGVLKGEQLDKAMKSLGSFNRQWDQAVDAVAFFKLDASKQQKALEAIEDYTLAQTEIGNKMRAMFEIGDMSGGQKLREEMDSARKTCIEAVKPMLTQEQAIKFEESLPRGMGGMRGPGGGWGGGGGGPRGGN
ncbi:MAG: hypothetical protein K2Y21_08610 [Phycisphaerales bacterium]|nr:hypothetical protein [Phycisphaerales bacterium]